MDRIQLRRDTSANWAEVNPILLEGEVGFEIDTKLRKIGDGVNRWNDLEYLRAEGISQETGNSQNLTMSQDAITRELNELGSEVSEKTSPITDMEIKLISDKLWNSASGDLITYSGYVCSEIVPYDNKNLLKHDGYISEYLYWNNDEYLGVTKSYNDAPENANRIAFNFTSKPTYVKIVGYITDITNIIDTTPTSNSKRLCYSGGIESRIIKAENGFNLRGHYYNDNGELIKHTSVRCTELLPINDESIVYIHNSSGGSMYDNIVYFDSNKQILRSDRFTVTPLAELCLTKRDFPVGAKYMAANGDNSDSYNAPFIIITTNLTHSNYLDDTKDKLLQDITWDDAGTPAKSYYSNFIKVVDGMSISTKNPKKQLFRVILYDLDKNKISNEDICFSDGEAKGEGGASGRFQGSTYTIPSGYYVAYVKIQYVEASGEPNLFVKLPETELIARINELYFADIIKSKKVVTIGDSLTANCIWQPYVAEHRGLVWSKAETINGVGYVNISNGAYTTEDMSSDENFRKAYPMAIGGTTVRPRNENSIYIRGLDAVYYKPDIILIYGGENDFINTMSGSNPWGNNSLSAKELVEQTEAYKGGVSTSVGTMAAFKGLIEQLLVLCPKAKIYLIAPMRCRCDIGKIATEGSYAGKVRFNNLADVIDYDVKDRIRRRDYIKALGEYYGLPVIDLMDNCGVTHFNERSWYGDTSVDCTQVHPNAFGYLMMAKCIATYI